MALIVYGGVAVLLLLTMPGWRKAGPASHRHQSRHLKAQKR